ncbi:MAG: hypothetical protein ACFFCY_15935 [Promethearchaeota archaeon]
MEDFEENQYYKPNYSTLFNKIKEINTPIKNEILIALLDGQWHSELELIRVTKKQHEFIGAVTLGTMISSLNHYIQNNYLQKKIVNGKMMYKLNDNYVGLTRAAYRFDSKHFF